MLTQLDLKVSMYNWKTFSIFYWLMAEFLFGWLQTLSSRVSVKFAKSFCFLWFYVYLVQNGNFGQLMVFILEMLIILGSSCALALYFVDLSGVRALWFLYYFSYFNYIISTIRILKEKNYIKLHILNIKFVWIHSN